MAESNERNSTSLCRQAPCSPGKEKTEARQARRPLSQDDTYVLVIPQTEFIKAMRVDRLFHRIPNDGLAAHLYMVHVIFVFVIFVHFPVPRYMFDPSLSPPPSDRRYCTTTAYRVHTECIPRATPLFPVEHTR